MKLIKMQHHNEELQKLRSTLSDKQKGLNESNREQGASSLLSTTIPPSEEGYGLTKKLLWDLICIRYIWTLTILPSSCECGTKFDIQHALSCKKRGFVLLGHNHNRNIMPILLKEVEDVRVELPLQQLMGEYLQHPAAAGNEISACCFLQIVQMAFLVVGLFKPNAKRYANIELYKGY